ncbi:hypothetical protein V8E36_007894 [Tilletia maclaganii]
MESAPSTSATVVQSQVQPPHCYRSASIISPDCPDLLLRTSRLPSIMSTTMSLTELDHVGRMGMGMAGANVGFLNGDARRQSHAGSISTLWSSADVPLFLDTRPSLASVTTRYGLDAPISMELSGHDGSQDPREILSQLEASPAMMSDSTPRSSLDPIPAFLGSNSSPSSFAASRYGRKLSQDSPKRKPPPLQLQSSNAFQAMDAAVPAIPASLSYGSQVTMIPQSHKQLSEVLQADTADRIPSAKKSSVALQSPLPLPHQMPIVQERRSSLKKKSSSAAMLQPTEAVPMVLPPAVRNRLYAHADRYFQPDYSVASPALKQQQQVSYPSPAGVPMSAPPTAACVGAPLVSPTPRKSSLSSSSCEAHSISRDNSMPGSLSHTSTSSSAGTSSSCCPPSDGGEYGTPSVLEYYADGTFPSPNHSYKGMAHFHSRAGAAQLQVTQQTTVFGRSAKGKDLSANALSSQGYEVLPPTPQRTTFSQQSSPSLAQPALVPVHDARLPLLSTAYLGAAPSECTPFVQSPIALPTPVSSFSDTLEPTSSGPQAWTQQPSYGYTSPSVSPTQTLSTKDKDAAAARNRAVSASRLLHAASMKLLRSDSGASDVPPALPLTLLHQGQRPSTATTDGCNLRPRARTVGDKERPTSLQPAARIGPFDSLASSGGGGAGLPMSTMTSSNMNKASSLGFRPKSKGGWASHLSGGLTIHIDQDNHRSVQINLSYLNYDPFGRSETLVPPGTDGSRPATPKRSKTALKASAAGEGDDDATGILEFGPIAGAEDGWVFQHHTTGSSSSSSAPILKHLTVGPEIKTDVLTRQAKLQLGVDGVHEVCGCEKRGKLGWKFVYRVEPCLDSVGRPVASGEKIIRPVQFLCSATLLDPSRAQKSRLINLVRKQVNANLVSTPVRSPASRSSQAEARAGTLGSTVPSPLSASTRLTPMHPMQHHQHLQQQQQQHASSPAVLGLSASSTASPMRGQHIPSAYSLLLTGSTTSLVSSSGGAGAAHTVVAEVQRLDPSQVAVPAGLPAGVVPFKLVRNKAAMPVLMQAAAAKVQQHPMAAGLQEFVQTQTQGMGIVGARAGSAATLPPVTRAAVEFISPVAAPIVDQRPRIPSFGDKYNAIGLQLSAALQGPFIQHYSQTGAQASAAQESGASGRYPSTFDRAAAGRRIRSHTSAETKLRRPMTASELIKRQWEDKQRDQDRENISSKPGGTFDNLRKTEMLRPTTASCAMLPPSQQLGAQGVTTPTLNGTTQPAELTVFAPEFFGSGTDRRRSRTFGAGSALDRAAQGRPSTAQPLSSASSQPPLPLLPRSTTTMLAAMGDSSHHGVAASAGHHHRLGPQDGGRRVVHSSEVDHHTGSGSGPAADWAMNHGVGRLRHSKSSFAFTAMGPTTNSTMTEAAAKLAPPFALSQDEAAAAAARRTAVSALLRQMPTTIVVPPAVGSAPVPPKRSPRRPRTGQTMDVPVSSAFLNAHGGRPCTPGESGSFGVAPLVDFSPKKLVV